MLKRIPLDSAGRDEPCAETAERNSDERLTLAFELWDEGCRSYSEIHGVSLEEAAEKLSAARQIGRIPLFEERSPTP